MTTNEYSHWLKANRRSLDNRANKKKNEVKKSQEILNDDAKELQKSRSRNKINIFEMVSIFFF